MWLFERPIAHRGYHNETATENSMSAFRLAIEKGYNIETDVHLLKSGEVVIFHDNTLKRVCKKNVAISELTLDDIKSDNYLLPNGEHIPLFSELLDIIDGEKNGILLELKFNGFNYDLEKAVYELIKGKESYIAVQAFNPYTSVWFKNNAPEFTRGMLSDLFVFPLTASVWNKGKPDFLAYNIKFIDKCILNFVEKKNTKLLSWTVRAPKLLAKAIDAKVNNIIFEKLDLDELGFSKDKLKSEN